MAQIITFGTLGAKAAVRDVGRALGMSYADVDRVARLIPNALHMTLDRALNESTELRAAYETDSQVRNLVDTARTPRGRGAQRQHARRRRRHQREPLVEHLPLARPARGDAQAMPTTQYAMEQVAAIGLVKMDLLGLSNLTILAARRRPDHGAPRRHGRPRRTCPTATPKTFEMLGGGETFGVFQLESAGMRRAVQELQARPASTTSRRSWRSTAPARCSTSAPSAAPSTACEQISYPHPDLADILD